MEPWEITASVVTIVAILIAAFIIHGLNRWHRWSIVESDSIRRTTLVVPSNEIPVLKIIRYEYVHGQEPVKIPPIMFLSPGEKYHKILDQYATGLCLAEVPVVILEWQQVRGDYAVNFANIAAKVEPLLNPAASGIIYVMYRRVAQEIVHGVACAAKNPNNQWILISPQLGNASQWEIFAGNEDKIHVIFSRDAPKKIRASIENLKTKLKIPEQNLAPFPIGGMDLRGQETAVLGKMISWISRKNKPTEEE